jgi:hypothetical protein
MQRLELKPTHKPVRNYYSALRQFDDLGVTHETAVRSGVLDHPTRFSGGRSPLALSDHPLATLRVGIRY